MWEAFTETSGTVFHLFIQLSLCGLSPSRAVKSEASTVLELMSVLLSETEEGEIKPDQTGCLEKWTESKILSLRWTDSIRAGSGLKKRFV